MLDLWSDTRLSRNNASRMPAAFSRDAGFHTGESSVTANDTSQRKLKSEVGDYNFRYLLPPRNHPELVGQIRKLDQYTAVWDVYVKSQQLKKDGGECDLDTENSEREHIGVGYVNIHSVV